MLTQSSLIVCVLCARAGVYASVCVRVRASLCESVCARARGGVRACVHVCVCSPSEHLRDLDTHVFVPISHIYKSRCIHVPGVHFDHCFKTKLYIKFT